jgi:cell wall-associated NlpC family hydrolase
VIFWKKNAIKNGKRYSLVNHVGIYIGNGQFIHTSDETGKVTTDSVSGMYKNGTPYYARWSHT